MLDRRGRRHRRRHRVAAVPRGDPPAALRGRRAERRLACTSRWCRTSAPPASSRPSRRSTRCRSCARSASSPTSCSCRSERPLERDAEEEDRDVLQRRAPTRVFSAEDVDAASTRCRSASTSEGLDEKIAELLNIWSRAPRADRLGARSSTGINEPASARSTIGFVGKYVDLVESYKSLNEALHPRRHRQRLPRQAPPHRLRGDRAARRAARCSPSMDGILVAPGFGSRGTEGKIAAVRYAREQQRAVLRHLPRHAAGGDRVRAQRVRPRAARTRPSSTRRRRTRWST